MVIICLGGTGGGVGGASRIIIGSGVRFVLVGRWRNTRGGASGGKIFGYKMKKLF